LANHVPELSLDEKVSRSDIVVIGKATGVDESTSSDLEEHSTFEVIISLKGTPPTRLTIISRHPISELSPACCAVGARYLLFLRHANGDVYESVNGPHGVYELTEHAGE
jgi:hypothetical protein